MSFAYQPNSYDLIVSEFTLHHLPDFWKAVALARIYGALKPGAQFFLRQAVRIGVAAEPTPKPLVGVFHRTFLLGQLRPAEPCLRANLSLQVRPVDKLGSAIKGDRSAGMPGQGRERLRAISSGLSFICRQRSILRRSERER